MKKVSGQLSLLGDSIINAKQCNYSLIKIGGQILPKVVVPIGLNNFLDVDADGVTTLHYVKLFYTSPLIIGIETPSGERYYAKTNAFTSLIILICSIILIPFLGLGLLFLPAAFAVIATDIAGGQLQDQGFTPVK
ncbi:hypothetical protein [Nitrospirillum iridis]|uniref:Uncharacterized protein n=1 Tax=Nitrospirillum iridis TaxID=765888 RepID=A0A7X0AZC5_9PROT|nr:hypothetical protein [Nitrospirillum iridis]MBB6251466.1 hypothetical protein [Nitrospirillum iridis]